jgi:hypothetical protein
VYDPQKEEFEQRIQRVKEELGMTEHIPGSSIRGSFQAARVKKPVNIFGLKSRITIYIKIISIVLAIIAVYLTFYLLMAAMSGQQQTETILQEPEYVEFVEVD